MACAVRSSTKPPRHPTQRGHHPATAGERAGLRRPVHPMEDAQIRCDFDHSSSPLLLLSVSEATGMARSEDGARSTTQPEIPDVMRDWYLSADERNWRA